MSAAALPGGGRPVSTRRPALGGAALAAAQKSTGGLRLLKTKRSSPFWDEGEAERSPSTRPASCSTRAATRWPSPGKNGKKMLLRGRKPSPPTPPGRQGGQTAARQKLGELSQAAGPGARRGSTTPIKVGPGPAARGAPLQPYPPLVGNQVKIVEGLIQQIQRLRESRDSQSVPALVEQLFEGNPHPAQPLGAAAGGVRRSGRSRPPWRGIRAFVA